MAHTVKDKNKLISRVKRIRGQVDGLVKALDKDQECSKVLQIAAACRGAINSFMAEIMEGHIHFHVLTPDKKPDKGQTKAAKELVTIIKTYLK